MTNQPSKNGRASKAGISVAAVVVLVGAAAALFVSCAETPSAQPPPQPTAPPTEQPPEMPPPAT